MAPNTNYSVVNNYSKEAEKLEKQNRQKMSKKTTTRFKRVRVIIVRLKNKNYKENIDCSDFTFASTTYQFKDQVQIREEPQIGNSALQFKVIDAALYGHGTS